MNRIYGIEKDSELLATTKKNQEPTRVVTVSLKGNKGAVSLDRTRDFHNHIYKLKNHPKYIRELNSAVKLLETRPFNVHKVIGIIQTATNDCLQENEKLQQKITELSARIVELTTNTVTARMRLDGKDDEKRAIEEILKYLNAGTLKEYAPNRGRMTEKARMENNPYQYIRDNIVPILETVGLEHLAHTSIIYKNTMPAFYKIFNAYASLRRRENLSKTEKPKKQKIERRNYVCYQGSDAIF